MAGAAALLSHEGAACLASFSLAALQGRFTSPCQGQVRARPCLSLSENFLLSMELFSEGSRRYSRRSADGAPIKSLSNPILRRNSSCR